jgi:hypothetical protein
VRITNRVIAAVAAIMLTAVGTVIVVEVFVAQILKRSPWIVPYDQWLDSARANTWAGSDTVLQLGVGLTAGGIAVVLFELIRRRPTGLSVAVDPDLRVQVQRRSLEHSFARAAERVDAVRSARVKLRKDVLQVDVTTARREAATIEADVTMAVIAALHRIHPTPEPSVRVKVTRREQS